MKFAEKVRNFLEKLQNLADHKKQIILWTVVVIIGLPMGFFWINSAFSSLSSIGQSVKMPVVDVAPTTPTTPVTSIAPVVPSDDQKTYTNKKYNFQIQYPKDWTARDCETGVAFSPKNNTNGQEAINIGFYTRGSEYCKIPFEDYIKISGPSEIQNYQSIDTITGGVLDGGARVYEITWNYTDLQGMGKISLPITYFETNQQSCGTVEAFLNDNNYKDIYNQIISTFKFTK